MAPGVMAQQQTAARQFLAAQRQKTAQGGSGAAGQGLRQKSVAPSGSPQNLRALAIAIANRVANHPSLRQNGPGGGTLQAKSPSYRQSGPGGSSLVAKAPSYRQRGPGGSSLVAKAPSYGTRFTGGPVQRQEGFGYPSLSRTVSGGPVKRRSGYTHS